MQKYLCIVATLVITSCALGSQPTPSQSYAEKITQVEQNIMAIRSAAYDQDNPPSLKDLNKYLTISQELSQKGAQHQDQPQQLQSITQSQHQVDAEFHSKFLAAGGMKYVFLLRYQDALLCLEQTKSILYKAMHEESQAEVARLKALLLAQEARPHEAEQSQGFRRRAAGNCTQQD